MYRLLFIAVVMLWLAAVAALVHRDIWPAWTAQDPPPMTATQFAGLERREQFAIQDGQGRLIGRAWGEVGPASSGLVSMSGTILIDGLSQLPYPIRVETESRFDGDGELDSFDLDVFGVPMIPINVHGERRGIYFPCELKVGTLHRQANLDLSASRMIGESIRPFNVLPKLRVGQSWRMQLLDPVAAVLKKKTEFSPVIARVTHRETLSAGGGPVECFVVEIQDHGRAWVDDDGRVRRQVVNSPLPMLGKLTLEAEVYDENARKEARRLTRSRSRVQPQGAHGGSD